MKRDVNLPVSVIVPEFNAKEEDIKDLLVSLLASDYPVNLFEIIIVDDGSEKNHVLEIIKTVPNNRRIRIQFVRSKRNLGPSSARNLGAHFSKGHVLAFSDSDCVPERNWIRNIVNIFSRFPEAAAVSGPPRSWPRNSTVGKCENQLRKMSFGELKDGFKKSWGAARGGNFAIRRDVFFLLNGFDESLRTKEDHELAQRILDSGNKIYFSNKVIIYHKNRQSLRDICKQTFRNAVGDGIVFLSYPNLVSKQYLSLFAFLISLIISSVFIASLNVTVAMVMLLIPLLLYFPFIWLYYPFIKRQHLKNLRFKEKIVLSILSMIKNSVWCLGFLVGIAKRIQKEKAIKRVK